MNIYTLYAYKTITFKMSVVVFDSEMWFLKFCTALIDCVYRKCWSSIYYLIKYCKCTFLREATVLIHERLCSKVKYSDGVQKEFFDVWRVQRRIL